MPTNTINDQLKRLPLFIGSEKTTYGVYPEFQPHIGHNYESNSERTLVVSEIFSTKNSISDRKENEPYCEYVLKNANNLSCIKTQLALQEHDENLTAENIAFCFFVHNKNVKVGSYRSNFPPKDLDDAINTFVPLINFLKPQKIIFLGSQTKRTVERRSGSKTLNGKSFEQLLVEFSIKTEIISLRASIEEKMGEEKIIEETVKFRNALINSNVPAEFGMFISKCLKDLDVKTNVNEIDIENRLNETNLVDDFINLIGGRECEKKIEETINRYYDDVRMDRTSYKNYIDDCVSFISVQIAGLAGGLAALRYSVSINEKQLSEDERRFVHMLSEIFYKRIDKEKKRLQCMLIPIKAIQDNCVEHTDVSISKVQFVKDLVDELRPKSNDDPGLVMSLQMVAKRLNESDPPITTALGKKYDSKGKGVIVLLRNVYKTLTESFFEEDQGIAAEMLHCFTKRPVAKIFVRNEDNVTEEEYWKPFKNMDAKES